MGENQVSRPEQVQYSRGFHVYNWSSYPIRLGGVAGSENFEGRPNDGDILAPGLGPHDFEVTFEYFSDQSDTAGYQILDDNGAVIGVFNVTMNVKSQDGLTGSSCNTTVGICNANNTTVTLSDPPGTVYDIPAGQGQAQAQVLRQYCNDGNQASFTFTVTKEESVLGPEHQVGDAYVNATGRVQPPYEIDLTDTVGTTDSVEVALEIGVKIAKIVSVAVTAKYSHTWVQTHDFTAKLPIVVDPGCKGWFTVTEPMIRDTGDFVVNLGNTTWNLHDVYFDSPDPTLNGTYVSHESPVPPEQLAALQHDRIVPISPAGDLLRHVENK
jgi:hypothetical protein